MGSVKNSSRVNYDIVFVLSESFIFISVLRALKMAGPLNFEVGFQVGFSNVCKFWWTFVIIAVGYVHRQLAYRRDYERRRGRSTIGWKEQTCV